MGKILRLPDGTAEKLNRKRNGAAAAATVDSAQCVLPEVYWICGMGGTLYWLINSFVCGKPASC